MSACLRFFVASSFVFVCLAAGPPARAERIVYRDFVSGEGVDGIGPGNVGRRDVRDGVFRIVDDQANGLLVWNEAGYERRAVLEFATARLQDLPSVDRAALVFYITGGSGPFQAKVHGFIGNGVLETGDLGAQNLAGETLIPTGGSEPVRVEVDVTGYVRKLANFSRLTTTNVGFVIRTEPERESSFTVHDRRDLPPDYPPAVVLEIDFTPVPEPAAGVLALTAAVGGGLLATRRRSRARAS